jgi:hypothetical protein
VRHFKKDQLPIVFQVVDLAGAERGNRTKASTAQQKEANNINVSLMQLWRCLQGMRKKDQVNPDIIPFRESKLTHILMPLLSRAGLAGTGMVVCVNPQVDGNLIRITLPQMTAARREELIKLVNKKAEDGKIAIRNIRKDVTNIIREGEKKKLVSEDFAKKLSKLLQDLTDQYIAQITTLGDKKQTNLKSI